MSLKTPHHCQNKRKKQIQKVQDQTKDEIPKMKQIKQ